MEKTNNTFIVIIKLIFKLFKYIFILFFAIIYFIFTVLLTLSEKS